MCQNTEASKCNFCILFKTTNTYLMVIIICRKKMYQLWDVCKYRSRHGKNKQSCVPAIIISFDLIRAFQGYSFWSVGVVLKRTSGFSQCMGCCLVSGHGWTDCLPTYKSYNRNNDINMQRNTNRLLFCS